MLVESVAFSDCILGGNKIRDQMIQAQRHPSHDTAFAMSTIIDIQSEDLPPLEYNKKKTPQPIL
jgi:hypothetical protein